MLQSSIFADLQATSFVSPVAVFHGVRAEVSGKNSFARLAAWGRSLLARDEMTTLNMHLLRDIGIGGRDSD